MPAILNNRTLVNHLHNVCMAYKYILTLRILRVPVTPRYVPFMTCTHYQTIEDNVPFNTHPEHIFVQLSEDTGVIVQVPLPAGWGVGVRKLCWQGDGRHGFLQSHGRVHTLVVGIPVILKT